MNVLKLDLHTYLSEGVGQIQTQMVELSISINLGFVELKHRHKALPSGEILVGDPGVALRDPSILDSGCQQ